MVVRFLPGAESSPTPSYTGRETHACSVEPGFRRMASMCQAANDCLAPSWWVCYDLHWRAATKKESLTDSRILIVLAGRVTQWQPHTVRGFISRALVHDLGLRVARF